MATLHRFAGSQNLWNASEIELNDGNGPGTNGNRNSQTSDLGSDSTYNENGRGLVVQPPKRGNLGSESGSTTPGHNGVGGSSRYLHRPSQRSYLDNKVENEANEPPSTSYGRTARSSVDTNSVEKYSLRERESSFLAKHFSPSMHSFNSTSNNSDFPPDPFSTLRRPQERYVDPRPAPPRRHHDPSPSSALREREFQKTFSVSIRKRNNSFGFKVVGGTDNPKLSNADPSIVVSDVTPRGAADGVLRPRDVILSVNDYSMRKVTQIDYHNYLQYVMDEAYFEIGRPHPTTMSLEIVNPSPATVRKVTLHKMHPDEDFGVRIGLKYFIRYIPKNSAASRGNELKTNDTIIQINGVNVSEMAAKDVRALVNVNPEKLEMMVETPSGAMQNGGAAGGGTLGNPNLDTTNMSIGATSPVLNSAPNSLISQTDSGLASMIADEAPARPPLPSGSYGTLNNSQMSSTGRFPDCVSPNESYSGGVSPNNNPSNMPLSAFVTTTNDEGGFSLFNATKDSQSRASYDSRVIQFDGSRPLGLKLAGGNATGVFIMAVQEGSQSKRLGLVQGDQITQVGEKNTMNLSREEVLQALQATKSTFDTVVKYNHDGFTQFKTRGVSGDSYYVRAHFMLSPSKEGHLQFDHYQILHVTDSLPPGGKDKEGYYIAARVGTDHRDHEKGLIPNRGKAAEIRVIASQSNWRGRSKSRGRAGSLGRGSRFRSLSRGGGPDAEITNMLKTAPREGTLRQSFRSAETLPRNSKISSSSNEFRTLNRNVPALNSSVNRRPSLFKRLGLTSSSKDVDRAWMLAEGPSTQALPAYERVRLNQVSFPRPVVIFGPISDVARDRLRRELPQKFELPLPDDFAPNVTEGSTVNLASMRQVINKGCHCLLDVTPGCVEWLNMVGMYPIVIFFKPDDKRHIKTVRSSFKIPKSGLGMGGEKSHKKLFRIAVEIEKCYSHLFSETIHMSANDVWFTKLADTIKKHQSAKIWMSESPNVDESKVADVSINVGDWAKPPGVPGGGQGKISNATPIVADLDSTYQDSNISTPTSTLHRNRGQQRSKSENGGFNTDFNGELGVDRSRHNSSRNSQQFDLDPNSSRISGRSSGFTGVRSNTVDADLGHRSRMSDRDSITSSQRGRPQTLISNSVPGINKSINDSPTYDSLDNPQSPSSQYDTLKGRNSSASQLHDVEVPNTSSARGNYSLSTPTPAHRNMELRSPPGSASNPVYVNQTSGQRPNSAQFVSTPLSANYRFQSDEQPFSGLSSAFSSRSANMRPSLNARTGSEDLSQESTPVGTWRRIEPIMEQQRKPFEPEGNAHELPRPAIHSQFSRSNPNIQKSISGPNYFSQLRDDGRPPMNF